MELPSIVSRADWLTARKALLAKEKQATRAKDALDAERRALPMVEIDKDYVFEGPGGRARLADLFDGRRQLIVYHHMWLDGQDQGCPSCSLLVDGIGGLTHLYGCDTSLVLVFRAQPADVERFTKRMGWSIPWYSSHGTDFNYDFHVTADESVAPIEYNYMDKATLEAKGQGYHAQTGKDSHGLSVFLKEGDRVFHTYSTYGRGPEAALTTYNFLDWTPLGRVRHVAEFPHHDRYGEPVSHHH